MRRSMLWLGALLGALVTTSGLASAYTFDDLEIEYWTGSGQNEAVVIIDWKFATPGIESKAFGYRWGGAKTIKEMIEDIAADPRLYAEWTGPGLGAVNAYGWDASGNGVFEETDPADWFHRGFGLGIPPIWWQHFKSDTNDGENWTADELEAPANEPLPNGHWDAWVWTEMANPQPPDIPIKPEIIPEPVTFLLVGLGVAALSRRLRKGFS